MWGAKSGVEQLPPFPEPSHNAKKTKSGHSLPVYVKDLCVVQFQTAKAEDNALPVVWHQAAYASWFAKCSGSVQSLKHLAEASPVHASVLDLARSLAVPVT